MIHVNLLRDQTARAKKIGPKTEVSKTGLLLLLAFLAVGGGLGYWWWIADQAVADLEARRGELRQRILVLDALKKQYDVFEKKKKLLESRIDIIRRLKENQTGPVQLLNHLIQSVPEGDSIWLTLVDQKSDRIQIAGYAVRSESIPGFLSNLARSGMFATVDLESIEDEKVASRFSVVCTTSRKPQVE